MTPEEDALGQVIAVLDRLDIPYMVTGSIASSYHGRPRATHDADIVIDPTPEQLDTLVSDLAARGFYVNGEGAREALRRRRPFNVIEKARATKVDVIPRRSRPFSIEEFSRRVRANLAFGTNVAIVTPEDAILAKLESPRAGGDSERQIRDAAGVLELNPRVDRAYIEKWALTLGVTDLWQRLTNDGG